MDPETEPTPPALEPPSTSPSDEIPPDLPGEGPPKPYRGLKWIFVGPEGLRSGWSVLIFLALTILLINGFGSLFLKLHLISGATASRRGGQSSRKCFKYSRSSPRRLSWRSLSAAESLTTICGAPGAWHTSSADSSLGFAALSALVGSLAWGHWLRFGPVALGGSANPEIRRDLGCRLSPRRLL